MNKVCVFDLNLNSLLASLFLLNTSEYIEICLIDTGVYGSNLDVTTDNLNYLFESSGIDLENFIYETKSTFKICNSFNHKNNKYPSYYDSENFEKYINENEYYNCLKQYYYNHDLNNLGMLNRLLYPIFNLCDYNLFTKQYIPFDLYKDASYQINYQNSILYFKNLCLQYKNFKCIKTDRNIKLTKENGYIKNISFDDYSNEFDLYIDCSIDNFLISNTNNFINLDKIFINNNLLNYKIKYINKFNELLSFNKILGINGGLNYNISLYEYNNLNYSFSDSFEFSLVDNFDLNVLEKNHITYNPGYYEESWKYNILGLGPTLCYFDSIEANELFNIQNLLSYLKLIVTKKYISEFDKYLFNEYYRKKINYKIYKIITNRYNIIYNTEDSFWNYHYTLDFLENFKSKYKGNFENEISEINSFSVEDIHTVYKIFNENNILKNEINKRYQNYNQWLKNNIFEKE